MILITGGLGFIGPKVARHFLDMGKEVLITGHRNLQIPSFLAPYAGKGLQITVMDVADLTTILEAIKKYKVTSIVHAVSVREGRAVLYQTMAVNVTGSANVLEAARLMDVGRVTFLSSEAVYQGRKDMTPLKEEEFFWVRSDRYTPVIKKMGELLFFIYKKEYKLDVVITRLSRIYGPDYPAGRPITRMIDAALKGGEAGLDDINENEGHDFLYARDCARALAMIHLAQKPRHAIYNIGSGKFTKFSDIARTLEKIFPGSVLKLGKGEFATANAIDYVPKTEYDIETCLDISRIKEEFGFVPDYDLEKGLSALVTWVRDGRYL
jgi:UDP-glucose 4-epimerase